MDKFAQITCNHSILCYNSGIRSMTRCFGKVEKRRSKNIRFLNFIMQQTTAVDGVLRPQLLTYKDTCKYVCIGRTTLREMIKNKQFDGKIFLGMIDILNRVDNKQITKYQGDMEFGSLIAKKYNIPMNFSDKDLKEISKKYTIPIDELKKHYSNLKK